MEFEDVRIRASYLNYFMVKLYVEQGKKIFDKEFEYEGNKPGTVIYKIKGDDRPEEIAPRWYDIYYLLNSDAANMREYLALLVSEEHDKGAGENHHVSQLDFMREKLKKECEKYYLEHPLIDNDNVVTMLSTERFAGDSRLSVENISHKGHMLIDLAQNCYSVPDFSIVTASTFTSTKEERYQYLHDAVHNLEIMTKTNFGANTNPLVFAIRSAMPQYIPGLMPTILNIGVTRDAYMGLCEKYGQKMAGRIYLNTLDNLAKMLELDLSDILKRYGKDDKTLTVEQLSHKINDLEDIILQTDIGEGIITDAYRQLDFTTDFIIRFYVDNEDLIATFMQGRRAYPSLILQKMVWTIGNEHSYPGVLHSFHSRTGAGRQIETYEDIFGEEIMTGDVSSNDVEYFDRQEIKNLYPAIYHFDPLLRKLEKRCQSPVTIEFAVETHEHVSCFAVLQLNNSELTGRAALLSSIELYEKGVIPKNQVVALIRPYHLRQIVSDSIDDTSFRSLVFFGKGVNVLPRSATSAVICFTSQKAREYKNKGISTCLCRERFVPEDTIILNEIDAIISITPAAIHVVTACRGYGIPAFLNLQSEGIFIKDNTLVNSSGMVIHEGDWITLSSRRQSIYIGKAKFSPARFMNYLRGQKFEMNEKEEKAFLKMKNAYVKYQEIVNSTAVNYISNIDTLARLIRNDLHEHPQKAISVVNEWYEKNPENYVEQVLESRMGSHHDQSRVYELLDVRKKIDFFKRAVNKCIKNKLSGLSAGAFMLGRFAARPSKQLFWQKMNDEETAFILNEYVFYEKYLQVLDEVGETKLTKAHSKIMKDGFDFNLMYFDLYNFVPLMVIKPDWNNILNEAHKLSFIQNSTLELIDKLQQPIGKVFDMSKSWEKEKIENLIDESM